MNFVTSRAKAIDKLNQFVEKNLSDYSKLRNFDFGPDKRDNVSCLSPYVTHGVLNEIEIIKKSLEKFSFSKNEKFIQEVLWRTYWKGWLELRPNVWSDYLIDLKNIKEKYKHDKNYQNAIEGKTNIDCFNEWVNELKNNNYLHNHTRMWFASIWIFTLDLPWQLGAEFFMQHLFDGDAASNTLGWRWVAGVQTQGKHYLASEWNIKKFTNNRFKNIKLNENAPPKISKRTYSIIKQDFKNSENIEPINLLIFDNNLSFEFTDFKDSKFKKAPQWLKEISKPPFAIIDYSFSNQASPAYSDKTGPLMFTLGGLETLPTGEVLNKDGEVIPKLYAAGRTTAGLPRTGKGYASGMSVGDATFFGRMAGISAAQNNN